MCNALGSVSGQTLRERALTTLALTCRCHTGGDYSDWANTLLSASILEYLIFFLWHPLCFKKIFFF